MSNCMHFLYQGPHRYIFATTCWHSLVDVYSKDPFFCSTIKMGRDCLCCHKHAGARQTPYIDVLLASLAIGGSLFKSISHGGDLIKQFLTGPPEVNLL